MNVLLGIGGTDDSFRALEVTIERTIEAGDDLTVAILDNPESEPEPGALEEGARERLADAGLDAEIRRLEGHPGSRLVEAAEREEFDRIVLGGGERSPMGKITVGHVAEFVILNATTTVTLVR